MYCKFGNFYSDTFIFANNVRRRVSDVKNSQMEQHLPISVNSKVISTFHEGFIFAKFRENKTLAKTCEFTVYVRAHEYQLRGIVCQN